MSYDDTRQSNARMAAWLANTYMIVPYGELGVRNNMWRGPHRWECELADGKYERFLQSSGTWLSPRSDRGFVYSAVYGNKTPPSPLDRRYTLAGFLNFPSNFAVRVPFHHTIGALTMRRRLRRHQRHQLSSDASSLASPGTVTQTASRGSHRRFPVPQRGAADVRQHGDASTRRLTSMEEAPRVSPGRPSHRYKNELGKHAVCAEVISALEEQREHLSVENEQLRLEEERLPPREDDRLRLQIQETTFLNHMLAKLLSDSSAGGLSVANQIITTHPTGLLNTGEIQAKMQEMDANWRQVTAGILQRAPGAALEPRVSTFVADNANAPNF
ncbi:hypothetical protein PISL3812_10002 [Talaromyces islandicus]|uniref:Uncharacterized protein n=1 Tax=Talaromyces islandicus TaxID=28573 RepID=A0A0U1MCS5_TALIS|nr:hypothetical protein PISL3812_10002 [Talaromyces islandicus]